MLTMLIVGAVAVWRLTHMLQEEDGPWALCEKLRSKVWAMKDTDGGFRQGFFCFKCLSVWVAIIFTLMYLIAPVLFLVLAVPLALSAAAIFMNDTFEKD